MKAVVFHEHGGPERLVYEDRPDPQLAPGHAVLRVKACALNHLDIWIRQGIPAYKIQLPHISGTDASGVVEAVAPDVTDVTPGQRVFVHPGLSCGRCAECRAGRDNLCSTFGVFGAACDGGYAERALVPARNLIPLPDYLSFETGAAFPLVYLSAWRLVMTLGQVQPGETVLVHGAGSGVGSAAIQIARLAGALVITTVGSEAKRERALAAGAYEVILYKTEDVAARVRALTDGRGADVVVEHIGPETWPASLAALAKGGRLVTCGATTGPQVSLDLRALFSRQLTIRGAYLGNRSELDAVTRLVAAGRLAPIIDSIYPLAEARKAQEVMLSRNFFGKLVLRV